MSNPPAIPQDIAYAIQNSFISPRNFQPQDFSTPQNAFFLSQLMNQQTSLQDLQMMTNFGNNLSFPSQFISSSLPNISQLLGNTDRRNVSSMQLQTNNNNFPFNLTQLGLSEQQISSTTNNFKIQGDKEFQPFSSANQFQFQDNCTLNNNQPLQLQCNLQALQQFNQQSLKGESQDVRLHQFLSTPLLNNYKPNESNPTTVDKKEPTPSDRLQLQCAQLATSDLSASCDKTYDASCQQELQKTLSLLQEQQNSITPTMPSCSKHQSKKDVPLNFICKTQDCPQQWSLMCRICVREHSQTHEIVETSQLLSQRKEIIQQNLATSCQYLDNIESFFGHNLKELERTKNIIEDLSETTRQLQRAYLMMKLNFTSDSNLLCDSFKQLDSPAAFSEKQINEKMDFITRTGQRIENDKVGFQKLLRSIETIGEMVSNIQNSSSLVQETSSTLLGSLSKLLVGSEMKDIEKKHQEEKTLEHFSKLFHLIKGHAKKRDVINFLTWEPQTKELKYSKDIKDKHGEHFYVSFSLQLKNLENMENKEIDENFIGKIVSVVEEKAPEIQNKKNQERKKIDPNGKKRKYCRFNPRIEIDVQLNSNSYKNIKIE